MPDESCRKCGGPLTSCSSCQECRKITQYVCMDCGLKTEEQFHELCLRVIPTRNGMKMNVVTQNQTDHVKTIRNMIVNKSPLQDALLIFSISGFFVLGFAAGGYLEMFGSDIGNAETMDSVSLGFIQHQNSPSRIIYENCLGYGNTQLIYVKCPDGMGSVYNAILDMPYNLEKKFSKDTFSIR